MDLLTPVEAVAGLLLLAEDPRDIDHRSSKLVLDFGFAAPGAVDVNVVGAIAGVELVRIGGEVGVMAVGRMGGEVAAPNIDV